MIYPIGNTLTVLTGHHYILCLVRKSMSENKKTELDEIFDDIERDIHGTEIECGRPYILGHIMNRYLYKYFKWMENRL